MAKLLFQVAVLLSLLAAPTIGKALPEALAGTFTAVLLA